MPSYFPPHISRPGPGYVGSRQSLPRQSDRGELEQKVPFIDFCHFPERHGITKSRSTSINQFTIHSLSIRILCHCPSLSRLFHCIPMSKTLFSQSELFSPRESRQPWARHRLRWMHLSLPTASLVALPSIGGDWIDTRRSLGLVRDTWNDPVVLLGCGSLKKVAAIDLDIVVLYQTATVGVRQGYSNLFMGSPRPAKPTTPKIKQ